MDPQPPVVDLAAIPDAELVDRVLATCHGPLRGDMDRVQVRLTLGDGTRIDAHADLPDKLRVVSEQGAFLLTAAGAFGLGAAPRRATEEERGWLEQLRGLTDAAALGPLQRATGCERAADGTFRIAQPGGEVIELRLRKDTLLPARVGDVTIVDHLRTSAAWITQTADHPVLGRVQVYFENADVRHAADFFTPPDLGDNATTKDPGTGTPRIRVGGPEKPATPIARVAKATRWLLLPDPGDWEARHAIYTPEHDRLVAQDQRIAGFPIFAMIDGKPRLAVPFRQRPGGPAATLPNDAEVHELDRGRELEVYPQGGDLATKRAAGERALRAYLDANGLEAIGPIACQPYVHLHEGTPDAARLRDVKVRMSVRIGQ